MRGRIRNDAMGRTEGGEEQKAKRPAMSKSSRMGEEGLAWSSKWVNAIEDDD